MNTPLIQAVGGPLSGQSFSVDAHGVRIGRDPANEVCVPSPDVSRHHARVILHNGALWVQDAGSRNGVYVNGNRVSGHKQVSPGDRIVVGNSEFQVGLSREETDTSVSVDMGAVLPAGAKDPGKAARPSKKAKKPKKAKPARAARSSGGKKWKIWPFAVAGVVLVLLLVLIALVGGGGGAPPDPGVGGATAAPAPGAEAARYSLSGLAAENSASEAPATATPSEPQGFASMLKGAAGSPADEMETWPKPPEGATFEDLRFKADTNFQQERLRDSLSYYQMALQLNRDCEVCKNRVSALDARIRDEVSAAYRDGLRYLDANKYQQAIYSFERTLLLDPDKTLEDTLRSVEQIEETRKKLPRQY